MLVKATLEQVEAYADMAYALALDPKSSGYPTYADGVKTKEDFLLDARRAASGETAELLLFVVDGAVEGWLSYFWIEEDRYLQLTACNIRTSAAQALAELLARIERRFPGYTLYFGLPGENEDAIRALISQGFALAEQAWNHVFFFPGDVPSEEDARIERIGRRNFDAFRAVYHPAPDAYWSAERILQTIDDWMIFVYNQNGTPAGTVFLQGRGGQYEIFGLEYAWDVCSSQISRALLAAALRACREAGAAHLTYFCPEGERQLLKELGFHHVGQYVLYTKTV